MALTLLEAKTKLARAAEGGVCATDSRLTDRINEVCERFITNGKWRGTLARVIFTQYNDTITLPREYACVLGVCAEDTPFQIKNRWYEFQSGGYGRVETDNPALPALVARGSGFVGFRDLEGNKRVRVYADLPEAVGAQILLRGLNQDGNEIYTSDGVDYYQGELVNIDNAAPTLSVATFSVLREVVKPSTVGVVRLYAYNATDASQFAIAIYQPSETVPDYTRYLVPASGATATNDITVTCMCKRGYVPVAGDNDQVVPCNIGALKLGLMALFREDAGDLDDASRLWAGAFSILNADLVETEGDASTGTLSMQPGYGNDFDNIV